MTTVAVVPSTESLEGLLASFPRPLIAFSGGVDSSVVLAAAARACNGAAIAVTARTESITPEDVELCRAIAARFGIEHRVIDYSELEIPNYAANPVNRCYFCKSELYTRLRSLASQLGYTTICDGSNLDDVGDWRPGLKAVAENNVRSPLREAGLGKAAVRELALHYGLPNHDRPSSPCLSSRIPYGQVITREKLDTVAQAERFLHSLGIRELRCRLHDKVARLEVHPDDFQTVLAHRQRIVEELRRLGFLWVSLDLAGFRSGSLNAALGAAEDGGGVRTPTSNSDTREA